MKTLFCLTATILFLALSSSAAFGVTKTSAKSGPYGFPSTWTDGIAPAAGDTIIIQKGHGVGGATGTINNLTLDGSLTYSGLTVTGDVSIGTDGVMSTLHGGFQLFLSGPKIVNDGNINGQTRINGDSSQEISGAGLWKGGGELSGAGEKTIKGMNVATGSWAVLSVINVNGSWWFGGGSVNKQAAGTVRGNGNVVFEKPGHLTSNESMENLWTVTIQILTRVTIPSSSSVSGPVFVRNDGAIGVSIGQVFEARSDLTIVSGVIDGQTVRLSGENITNDGDIRPVILSFNREGAQKISGDGSWRPTNSTTIGGSGEKSLLNSMSMNGSLVVDSALNINQHTLTVTAGTFRKSQTGTVRGTGKIVFKDDGILTSDDSTGNRFTTPVEINSGRRAVNSTSGISAPITVEAGATLSISMHVTLNARDDLTVKRGGSIIGQTLAFSGVNFVNDGLITTVATFFKSGSHVLSGNGVFDNGTVMETGSSTVLHGVQQFQTLAVRSGGSLDISNSTLRIGMDFSNSGTVTTTGSTIEYNGGNGDQTLLTNIAYHNLIINNPQQVFLHSPETVENTLRLQRGIFEISTNRLTIANCGQIIQAGGTLNGTPILGNCPGSNQ